MSSTDTDTTRKERIDALLLIIAGCELSLRQFPEDARVRSIMNKTKKAKLKELKEVIYGL
jgi:hypothetical protein